MELSLQVCLFIFVMFSIFLCVVNPINLCSYLKSSENKWFILLYLIVMSFGPISWWIIFNKKSINYDNAVPFRFLVAVLFIAIFIKCWHELSAYYNNNFFQHWWSSNEGNLSDPPSFCDLIAMLSCDPLSPKEKYLHRRSGSQSLLFFLVMTCISLLFGVIVDFILNPRIPDLFFGKMEINYSSCKYLFLNIVVPCAEYAYVKSNPEALANISQNLTAYLALIAAAVSIVFTFIQLRAKVRAESRQKWINELKKYLANTIAEVGHILDARKNPAYSEHQNDGGCCVTCGAKLIKIENYPTRQKCICEEFHSRRMLLEINLNPSEMDHRLLMFLIRLCVLGGKIIDHDHSFLNIVKENLGGDIKTFLADNYSDDDDLNVVRYIILKLSSYKESSNGLNCSKISDLVIAYSDEIISIMVRLSNIIIRREWERVRHTR